MSFCEEIRRRHCRVPTVLFWGRETALPCPSAKKSGDGIAVSLQYYFGVGVGVGGGEAGRLDRGGVFSNCCNSGAVSDRKMLSPRESLEML